MHFISRIKLLCAIASAALISSVAVYAGEPPTEPMLRIDPVGHTGSIGRIATDKAGRWLVTASLDKTARVWDMRDGRLVTTLRVPIGSGYEGKLAAVALSPDGHSKMAEWTPERIVNWGASVGVLVMMATIIGRKVGIRPMRHNDWTVICNLWAAVVGNSGVMKSPTLAAALSPIKKLQAAAYDAFNKAKAEHDNQAEVAKLQQSVNKTEARKKLKGNKSADVSGLLQSGETDDAPSLNRYITNNASYEALGELLMENPNGLARRTARDVRTVAGATRYAEAGLGY